MVPYYQKNKTYTNTINKNLKAGVQIFGDGTHHALTLLILGFKAARS